MKMTMDQNCTFSLNVLRERAAQLMIGTPCQCNISWQKKFLQIVSELQGSYGQGKSGNFEGVRESQG